ncbi:MULTISPECIES: YybH family protein [Bradyrhizobium]|uniref:YybH family protein n=1 Tax=Bradyrhizobium elkanii TaxID=29448 RepID=UPI00040E3186
MPHAADDIASDIIAKWAAAFSRLDADALSSLYSKHALFFGSNPKLYRGRDGVAAYFKGLPRWRTSTVQFSDVVFEQVGPDLVSPARRRLRLIKVR